MSFAIRAQWISFRQAAIAPDLGADELRERKRAFYAGAMAGMMASGATDFLKQGMPILSELQEFGKAVCDGDE